MAKGKERRAAAAKARSQRNKPTDKRKKKAERNERRGRTGTFIGAKLWERRQAERRSARGEGGTIWRPPEAPLTKREKALELDLAPIHPEQAREAEERERKRRGK